MDILPTPDSRMSVYAPLLGHLWCVLESYGVDPREVIDPALYDPGDSALPSRRISFPEYDAALTRAIDLVGDPALSVRSVRFFQPGHLGALGQAWLVSPNLRTAMHRTARWGRMFNEQVLLGMEEGSGGVRLVFRTETSFAMSDVVADAHVANLLQLCRMTFGTRLQPVDVTLTRPEPPDPAPWFEHYGPAVRFGQQDNSFTLSAADADAPLTASNAELVAVHEELIERYLMKLDRDNILSRIRLKLMEALPSGRVTENDMAGILNMSKRTMHRKLRENEATFRSVLAQVRKDMAGRYVRDRDFSMTEIAFLLGYNDTSAFSRAFRSWFGRSPTEVRERAAA